jgi:D-alanine-D-alanine ligase
MTPTTTRVAVIGGGRNCEHDVSLASAAAVANALEQVGYQAIRLTIDPAGVWRDREDRPIGLAGAVHVLRSCAVAFPVLHGPHGEDGTLAALCDLADVPCVGSPLGAGALAMDKWATKLVADALGIATAPARMLTRANAHSYTFTHPVVVKPVASGSSRGVSVVREVAEMGPALDAAFTYDDRILVEDLMNGREIDLAVLGRPDGSRVAAPALEIVVPDGEIFDYTAKYGGSPNFIVPAPLDEVTRAAGPTSSSPNTGRSSTRSTRRPASPRSRRCPGCSPRPGCPSAPCSTCWCATRCRLSSLQRVRLNLSDKSETRVAIVTCFAGQAPRMVPLR